MKGGVKVNSLDIFFTELKIYYEQSYNSLCKQLSIIPGSKIILLV